MIKTLKQLYSGKVRDLYEIDNHHMLMVATDRLSTFDVVLNQTIPTKGVYLTQISLFWFKQIKDICPTHLVDITTHTNSNNIDLMQQNNLNYLEKILNKDEFLYAKDRSLIVKKLKPIPIEFVIRGYLTGSGYQEYNQHGQICGQKLPKGLHNYDKLSYPLLTPTTKAKIGCHDEHISLEKFKQILGNRLANHAQDLALRIYGKGTEIANKAGIIIADTKLEFGIDNRGAITLIDELLTPDSSRFWDMKLYSNHIISSFDKQIVRDYLESTIKWNKQPPLPNLPSKIIEQTMNKYQEIQNLLCK